MARVQTSPLLSQIRSARSYKEQKTAIQCLKSDLVGHVQLQQKSVENGVLETLVQVLETSRSPSKPNGKDPRSHAVELKAPSEDESVRLHVIQLLASFALDYVGGPPFLTPLHAAGAIPALLANLCPVDNHPSIVLATLRALKSLSETAAFALPPCPIDQLLLADEVFAPAHLDSLRRILAEPGPFSTVSPRLVNEAAGLIGLLCREERHQLALASSGVLDALATTLAGFVVARGQVVPGAEIIAQNEGLAEAIPEAAPAGTSLAAVLDAVSAIIADSRLRACMLLYSQSILAVFPNVEFSPPVQDLKAAWDAVDLASLGGSRPRPLGAIDYLLPAVPGHPKASTLQIPAFPPLGASRDFVPGRSRSHPIIAGSDSSRLESTAGASSTLEDPEVPLIPWLMHLTRSSRGMESLAASSVLTSLYRSGFASSSREPAMGTLVVPTLMETLNQEDTATATPEVASTWVDPATSERWTLTERALTVLARLTTDNELLQKAVFECNAVKTLCKLLKSAYEPIPSEETHKPWSSVRRDEKGRAEPGAPAYGLGPKGQLPLQKHRIKLRENALKLVASLVSLKEDYRKAFAEQDVTSYIVESLDELPSKPGSSKERYSNSARHAGGNDPTCANESVSLYGCNPVPVLIAACHAVRMLARSVSIIRTTLTDAGIAEPLFRLTGHQDVQVQIAATKAICNLVIEFSPMRERLMQLGIMKVTCEHARSMNPAVRLNAVWSLKHLVNGLSTEMKKACVEELQPGWLVQLICDDTEDEALFARSRAERQSTLTVPDSMDEDVEMDQIEEESSKTRQSPNFGSASPQLSHERSRTGRLRNAESKLAALRDAELDPVRKARSDDLEIQEQGLDFIRNLLTASSSAGSADLEKDTTEMIDYLFNELGQDRLFEILASKLRVKVSHPFSRRFSGGGGGGSSTSGRSSSIAGSSTSSSSRVLYPQASIIVPTVYILVHIAASDPRYRQLVMAQTELLQELVSLFSSRDKEVRLALCHLVANLTWRDNLADTQASERRAEELRRLGMLAKLESLHQDDSELDVRERARIAIYQMKHGGAGNVAGGGSQTGGAGGSHH